MTVSRIAAAVAASVAVFALTGCALLGGMMGDSGSQGVVPPAELSDKTDRQTFEEALTQTNDLVQFMGGDWYDMGVPRELFDPTGRTGWWYGPCGVADTNQHSTQIMQIAPVADPLAKIEQVREHWKSLGYQVRQIGPAETDEDLLTGIFVDLPFGAGLGFHASKEMMAISTQGECYKEQ